MKKEEIGVTVEHDYKAGVMILRASFNVANQQTVPASALDTLGKDAAVTYLDNLKEKIVEDLWQRYQAMVEKFPDMA